MLGALLIAAAALVGALAQRTVGFGVPLVLVPALLIYFSGPTVVVIALLVATASNLLVIFAHRDKREIVWPVILRLFFFALPGLVVGAFIVTHIDKALMQIVVGAIVIAGVCVQEFVFPKPVSKLQVSQGINLTGFIAGILNSSIGVSGPALIVWFRTHACTTNQLRHNLATIFTFMNVISLTFICLSNPETLYTKPLLVSVALLPLVMAGNFIGRLIAKKINRVQFERIMFSMIVATGIMSIALGIINLR